MQKHMIAANIKQISTHGYLINVTLRNIALCHLTSWCFYCRN